MYTLLIITNHYKCAELFYYNLRKEGVSVFVETVVLVGLGFDVLIWSLS